MLCHKKIEPGTKKGEGKPIDVAWILYIGIAKMGYSEKEVYLMQMGKWLDLFEVYKNVYNFETAKQLYGTGETENEKKGSVMDL